MKVFIVSLSIVIMASVFLSSRNSPGVITSTENGFSTVYVDTEMKQLIDALKQIPLYFSDRESCRTVYHEARKHFKKVEFFIEHVSPVESKYRINGALVPKYNEYDERFQVDPQGFQRIEELLYVEEEWNPEVLKEEAIKLLEVLQTLRNHYLDVRLEKQVYLEILQFELVRMTSLNLNGYDATITQTNVQEAIWNLESMRDFITGFGKEIVIGKSGKKARTEVLDVLEKALVFLRKELNYERFNRLDFAVDHVETINRKLISFHRVLALPWSTTKQALHLQAGTLFGSMAFNNQFFSIYYNDTLRIEKQANLGKLLFYDPILSGNNERSCASCHNPRKAFTDGLPKSQAFDKEHQVLRNAPSLVDVLFQKAFFYDGKAYQLEQQVSDVVHNQDEMGSSLSYLVGKLRMSTTYTRLFDEAFLTEKDRKISVYAIQKALAAYEKTLVSFQSRFDRYLAGERTLLTPEEKEGYNLFAGKALCGTCHFFPVFNGTVPPYYMDSEYEVLGVPETKDNRKLDPDLGRYRVTKADFQKYAFKTPTVRNSAVTAPYMHNGVYPDLKSVLDFYQKGGGEGLKYPVPNQTLPFDTLKLSLPEQLAIIRFLESLTDTSGLIQRPFALPEFEGQPEWNKRTWGGSY